MPMFDGLLQTKLFIPSSRAVLVPRPQLIDRLEDGKMGKLTLISAPAGYGKTTLVSEWIAASDRPFAWLSLDKNDQDPGRFLTYLIAAIQMIESDFGADLHEFLHTPQSPHIESVLIHLINEFAVLKTPLVLVLDDYHVLDSKPVDDVLSFFLDHIPANVHLTITTREDPAFSLSRMRARGELNEIRAVDLQFAQEEAALFLNQTMALSLTDGEIEQLKQRTEGWAAGLQMAAISMKGRTDTTAFVQAFTGSHRFVLDYLAEEVLDSLTDELRRFLFKTSILDRLSASLCEAVTENKNSQAMLEQLDRGNMLIIPLDDKREWYRYHHLFADVLQAHAKIEWPNQLPDWHVHASLWYEAHEFWGEAVHHALASNNLTRAADVIERAWPIIPKGIKPKMWLSWAKEIPLDDVRCRPVLSAAFGWISLDLGNLEEAHSHLSNAEQWLATPEEDQSANMIVANIDQLHSLAGTTACARAYWSQARGDIHGVINHAQRALGLLADSEHYWRGNAGLMLGMAQADSGELEAAIESISDSVTSQKKAENLYFQILGIVNLADIRFAQGRLHDALAYYEEALALAGGSRTSESQVAPITISLYVGLANLYREWGDFRQASDYLATGMAVSKRAIMPANEYQLYAAMAQFKEAEGDVEGALELLEKGLKLQQSATRLDRRPLSAIRARLLVRQGRLAEAIRWANSVAYSVEDEPTYQREFELMTYARVKLAEFAESKEAGTLLEAHEILNRLLKAAELSDRIYSVIEISILQALALNISAEPKGAVDAVQRAVSLAKPAGWVRIFADEGEAIRRLLLSALAQGAEPAYIAHLITAIDHQSNPDDKLAADPNQLLIEPLSQRELEVLNLLANGQTNQSIADELVIALSTVKKHVNNIFGKLNVESRTQAVVRARELKII